MESLPVSLRPTQPRGSPYQSLRNSCSIALGLLRHQFARRLQSCHLRLLPASHSFSSKPWRLLRHRTRLWDTQAKLPATPPSQTQDQPSVECPTALPPPRLAVGLKYHHRCQSRNYRWSSLDLPLNRNNQSHNNSSVATHHRRRRRHHHLHISSSATVNQQWRLSMARNPSYHIWHWSNRLVNGNFSTFHWTFQHFTSGYIGPNTFERSPGWPAYNLFNLDPVINVDTMGR